MHAYFICTFFVNFGIPAETTEGKVYSHKTCVVIISDTINSCEAYLSQNDRPYQSHGLSWPWPLVFYWILVKRQKHRKKGCTGIIDGVWSGTFYIAITNITSNTSSGNPYRNRDGLRLLQELSNTIFVCTSYQYRRKCTNTKSLSYSFHCTCTSTGSCMCWGFSSILLLHTSKLRLELTSHYELLVKTTILYNLNTSGRISGGQSDPPLQSI